MMNWTTTTSKILKTRPTLSLLILLAFTAGCSSTDNPDPVSEPVATSVAELIGVRWEWTTLTTPVEQVDIDAPERYTLEFTADGKLSGKADCNQLFGQYTRDGHRITLSGIGTTKMMCPPGSHFNRFLRDLGEVVVFSFLTNGDLILELPVDSGTLRFRAGA